MKGKRYQVSLDSPWDTDEVIERLKRQEIDAKELKARRDAMAVATYLGRGWKPIVWKNISWYWCVKRNGVKVSPSLVRVEMTAMRKLIAPPIPELEGVQFCVMFCNPEGHGMPYSLTVGGGRGPSELHIDPKEAVRKALAISAEALRERVQALEDARQQLVEWGLEDSSPPWWTRLTIGTLRQWLLGGA